VYAGEKLVKRFIKIDKLSTAMGTQLKIAFLARTGLDMVSWMPI
jgi:hypothetical protein